MTAGRPWYLYWVESDGIEDCFVIARNSRSARSIEYHMNGFEFSEVQATKIMRIPTPVEVSYRKSRKHKEYPWPEYAAEKDFFKALGAQFRTIDDCEEMLLEDVVYGVEEYAPGGIYKIRTIGIKAIEELRKALKRDLKYDDEDIWKGPVIHLITALGICLVRCQQIEHYISQSFLFGISKSLF